MRKADRTAFQEALKTQDAGSKAVRAIEELLGALCGTAGSQSLVTVSRSLAILSNYRHRDGQL